MKQIILSYQDCMVDITSKQKKKKKKTIKYKIMC